MKCWRMVDTGSIMSILAFRYDVLLTPDSDRIADTPAGPFGAKTCGEQAQQCTGRGRDASYLAPPAQNRTSGFPAYGSHLGCVTAKRSLGQG
jgi:hypothetical protein